MARERRIDHLHTTIGPRWQQQSLKRYVAGRGERFVSPRQEELLPREAILDARLEPPPGSPPGLPPGLSTAIPPGFREGREEGSSHLPGKKRCKTAVSSARATRAGLIRNTWRW